MDSFRRTYNLIMGSSPEVLNHFPATCLLMGHMKRFRHEPVITV